MRWRRRPLTNKSDLRSGCFSQERMCRMIALSNQRQQQLFDGTNKGVGLLAAIKRKLTPQELTFNAKEKEVRKTNQLMPIETDHLVWTPIQQPAKLWSPTPILHGSSQGGGEWAHISFPGPKAGGGQAGQGGSDFGSQARPAVGIQQIHEGDRIACQKVPEQSPRDGHSPSEPL